MIVQTDGAITAGALAVGNGAKAVAGNVHQIPGVGHAGAELDRLVVEIRAMERRFGELAGAVEALSKKPDDRSLARKVLAESENLKNLADLGEKIVGAAGWLAKAAGIG